MKLVLFTLLAVSMHLKAEPIKVMVIDTGFDFDSTWSNIDFPKPSLCKSGHKDFTGAGIKDTHGHGTHIAGLIGKNAGNSDYCLIIAKFYNAKISLSNNSDSSNYENSLKAFQYAIDQKVKIINYSGGGTVKYDAECKLIKKVLDSGIIIVAAAGNEGDNLDKNGYYPAMCDDRILVVANLDTNNRSLSQSSNYSHNVVAVGGDKIVSLYPNNKVGALSGTSQATAQLTGKLIKTLNILKRK